MTEENMKQLQKMMVLTFNDGFAQVVMPRLEQMHEEAENKIKESENRIKKELREEFKKGQQSLARTLEAVVRKLDEIIPEHKDYGKRLDNLERIVKAN